MALANPEQSKVEVGFAQINNSFSGQNYLPYSVALLEGFASSQSATPDRFVFRSPIYRRMPISEAVAALDGCDIAGFSTYVWNGRISLEIARRLKAQRPSTLIVFGGPHVPDQPEAFLRENEFIDVAVHNEGEQTFLELLESYPDRAAWDAISGISYIGEDGTFNKNPDRPRFRDLDEVPSPFLTGSFDRLIEENPHETWIGLWETNRGCPFRCTFCDWGSATAAKVTKFGLDRLKQEVDWFAENKIEYIFCCDANFGIQKRDVDIAEYVAAMKREVGYPHALSVQNTKNATERAYLTQKILADAGLNKGVALSMQSTDAHTLEAIKRDNISLDTYMELARRFSRDKIETYSDLILGLPGETYESFVDGVNLLIENGQHNRIQFNNLSILPNAEMGDAAYQEAYGMQTVESEIINIHGERVVLEDDVSEVQDLVVATNTMPPQEWRRTRAFCWMIALLHFDKLAQIPLMVANHVSGASYRSLIEEVMEADRADFPVVGEIRDFFMDEAQSIQDGGPEYVYSSEWLGIYWPADEYAFIKLTAEDKFAGFYEEVATLIANAARKADPKADLSALDDAIRLNRALVKQPFLPKDTAIDIGYDLMAFYDAVRSGSPAELKQEPTRVQIKRADAHYDDFGTWCREVVWWGNKKGAYLYTNAKFEKQLAAHF